MPLMWAHAEYIKLLRSAFDERVYDLVPEAARRYLGARRACRPLEIWKPNRQVRAIERGRILRVQAPDPFRLRWTRDEWQSYEDKGSTQTAVGVSFVDIAIPAAQEPPIRFTFFWTATGSWAGHDYAVGVN
jgi:glucoamylase